MNLKCKSAFTILELTIVVLVMGIIAASAAPRYFDALASYRVESAVKRITADMALAQRYAKQTSASQTLSFSVSDNSYSILGMSSRDRRGMTYEVKLGADEYAVKLISADFNGSEDVTFDIHGIPDQTGKVVIQSGDITYTLNVDDEGVLSVMRAVSST